MEEDNRQNKRTTRFTRNKTEDMSNLLYGKIPPQARELEEAVLGAILIEKDAISYVSEILIPESFYVDAHSTIFNAMVSLNTRIESIDLLTVTEELRKNAKLEEIGGAYYLSELTNKIASSANIEFHARIIVQKFIQRELIRISNDIIRDSYEDTTDVFELLEVAQDRLFKLAIGKTKNNMITAYDAAKKQIEYAERVLAGDIQFIGAPAGLSEVDRILHGFKPGDLIIIAGRPSMGKTAFAVTIAKNIASVQMAVGIFSLEMVNTKIASRLLSDVSGVPLEKIINATYNSQERELISRALEDIKLMKIFIDDAANPTVVKIRNTVRRLVEKHDVRCVIIDWLGFIEKGKEGFSTNDKIGEITRMLKAIAKEFNIPVILLCQLGRDVEKRGGEKKPQLSDLRDSGNIEQDADVVMFLYRPEYYGLTETSEGRSTYGICEVIIAKHRDGATGSVHVGFKKHYTKFHNLENSLFEMIEEKPKTIPNDFDIF